MPWDLSGFDWLAIVAQTGGGLLVLARVTGLCLTAPVLSTPGLEIRFRLGLSVLLTILIAPLVALPTRSISASVSAGFWPTAVSNVVAELLTGTLIGWAAGLIVSGAQLAGDMVAAQCGLSAATFFDPESGEAMTATGRLYAWVALAVFLSLDGPLQLVRALVESYQVIPAGGLFQSQSSLTPLMRALTFVLELALRAAAPAAIALVLAGIVIGWLSRAAPSFPLVALSLPVRAMVGIILLLLGLATLASAFSAGWVSMLNAS